MTDTGTTTRSNNRLVKRLAMMLAGAGIMHFVLPAPYRKIVPPQLGDADRIVKASGVAELACAGLLAVPQTRRIGGYASAVLFVAVFPANVYSLRLAGENKIARAALIARLPMQIPMITSALKVAREADQ